MKIHQPLETDERQYKAAFVGAHRQPIAVQKARADWKTLYKSTNDKLIKAHLSGDIWLGLTAAWYPAFVSLDIDQPTPAQLERIYERFDTYGIEESQRLVMTTPSYKEAGNHRIYLRLEYKCRTPTHKLSHTVLENCFGDLCEIYPQARRKDRLPCGRDADIIKDDVQLSRLTWQEEMREFMKLDAVEIEHLPRQPQLFEQPPDERDKPRLWKPKTNIRELAENGLQEKGTRHETQFFLLLDFWRQNYFQNTATKFVKKWIRTRHNGYSKDVNKANFRGIDAEISRQAAYIWAMPKILPDSTHNLYAHATKADLIFGAKLFPGDAVRQKQFFKLASFCRARRHHDWIFISRRIWTEEIASYRTYKDLQRELEEKGLLWSIHSYKVGEYSKRFQLELPQADAEPLIKDERNIDDYYTALETAFSPQETAELTQLNRMTLWRLEQDGIL